MIYPRPLNEVCSDGSYKLKQTYEVSDLYAFYISVKDGSPDISYEGNKSLEAEEYTLKIDSAGIKITYGTETAKYRALTSLYQLICYDNETLGYCDISDKPAFKNRGYMLDVSRAKIPMLKTILKYIDMLTLLKYNQFQLYFEAPVYKFERYKKYTDFDCLTPEDIIYIGKYCDERFIEFVPNQNSFGHMGPWLKFDEFKDLGLGDGSNKSTSLNPIDERSLDFVDGFYESLLPHFKSKYVNIGFDEVYELGQYQTEEACKKYGKETVFMDYLNKVADLIDRKYGKKVMFWDDMIVNYPSCYDRIPKGAIALEWGYELIQSQIMGERCRDFKENNIPFYVCPSINTHLSFTGRFDVTSFNLRTAGEVGVKHEAEGYLVTDWGNTGTPQFMSICCLPCALGGQYAWNIGVEQDGETFKTEYIYGAEDFVDKFIFKAKFGRILYRLGNYYLLEPERVHVGTMCGHTFYHPMKTKPDKFINLDKSGDAFYFDNVDRYVKDIIGQIKASDVDEKTKEETILNAEMVIFANMLNKVRVVGEISKADYEKATDDAEKIEAKFKKLWDADNFPVGKEIYIGALHKRIEELNDYIK